MRINLKRLSIPAMAVCLGLLPRAATARTGAWHSFTNMDKAVAMVRSGDFLFVGTTGGVRKINVNTYQESDYNNQDGLTDVQIVGMTVDPENHVWAASHSGMLFRFEGDSWSSYGRSYKSAGWILNDRAVLSAGKYIAVGSAKGLSFFDTKVGVAQVNLSKFGGEAGQAVTGMLRRGDTLYIATGKAVYKAAIDWENVLSPKYTSIYDPQIWTTADVSRSLATPKAASGLAKFALPKRTRSDVALAKAVRNLRAHGSGGSSVDSSGNPQDTSGNSGNPQDTLGSGNPDVTPTEPLDTILGMPVLLDSYQGRIIAHDSGLMMDGPTRVISLPGRALFVGPESFESPPLLEAGYSMENKAFLSFPGNLYVYEVGVGFRLLHTVHAYADSPIGNIAAKGGRVFGQTLHNVVELEGSEWKPLAGGEFVGPSIEIFQNPLKNLAIGEDGSAIVGHWGLGLVQIRNGDRRIINSDSAACLKPTLPPNYTVITSISDPRGEEVWLTLYQLDTTTYAIARYNTRTGVVDCPDAPGTGNKGIKSYSVRMLSDSILAIAHSDGATLFKYHHGSAKADLQELNRVTSDLSGDPTLDVIGDDFDHLWVLKNQKIGYVDSLAWRLATTAPLKVQFSDNITGHSCRAMEADGRKGIWVGCENGLFHIQPKAQADQSLVDKYTIEDGMLSDFIYDISVVPETGAVWIATDAGVNLFESPTAPERSNLNNVRAYPNPFRTQHRYLILDNVEKGSSATIFTQSGYAVKHFAPSDLMGNQFQWDGNNAAGAKVTPGIYLYSVVSGGKSTQGKIIVAR